LTQLHRYPVVCHPALSAHELWTMDALDYRSKERHLRKSNLISEGLNILGWNVYTTIRGNIIYNVEDKGDKITSMISPPKITSMISPPKTPSICLS